MANFFIITKTLRTYSNGTTMLDRQVREFPSLGDASAQMLEDYGAYKGSFCYKIEKAALGYCSGNPTYFKAVSGGRVVHEAFLVKVEV